VIFFPRSIENEILAHESGTRSRGFFGSRRQLTFVSQEQEIFGTYDLEEQIDCKDVSPTLSLTPLPIFPSKALHTGSGLQSPFSDLQQQPKEPTEPVCLIPNRRAPSPSCETRAKTRPVFDIPRSDNAYRFNNPATKQTPNAKPSSRSPIDLRGRQWR